MRYPFIIIIGLFCSCSFNDQKPVRYSGEALDTIKTTPAPTSAQPVLFETAFIQGTTQKLHDSTVQLYGINIGNIKLPSGKLVACDPILIEEYGIPFTQQFPTGEFPVQLSIARQGPEERIAFARIKFSNEPVAKWAFALLKDQEPLPVGGKKMHGFVVDGGLGIFADAETIKTLNTAPMQSLSDSVYREMDKHTHYDWRYNIHSSGNHNLAMFSTGFGDGRYATYIGFDANDKPCRLLTDMDIFSWKQ